MTEASSYADQVLDWVQPALRRLADSYQLKPDAAEEDLTRGFLDELGIGAPADHPVVSELLEHIEGLDRGARQEFLGSEADAFVHEAALRSVPPVEQDPRLREYADQAYQWVIARLTAEDPEFPHQLEADPDLAAAIYDEALQRFAAPTTG